MVREVACVGGDRNAVLEFAGRIDIRNPSGAEIEDGEPILPRRRQTSRESELPGTISLTTVDLDRVQALVEGNDARIQTIGNEDPVIQHQDVGDRSEAHTVVQLTEFGSRWLDPIRAGGECKLDDRPVPARSVRRRRVRRGTSHSSQHGPRHQRNPRTWRCGRESR